MYIPLSHPLSERLTRNICADVGAAASVMSKFFHPSQPIFDNYPNHLNNHNLDGVVLVEEDVKFVRQGADEIRVLVFTHADFQDKQLYAAKKYIHMIQEGTQEILFVLPEDPVPAAGAGGIGALAVGRKYRTDGAEANDAPNLLSGHTSNLSLEDMAEIFRQGIAIDYDKNTAPDNVTRQGETTDGTGKLEERGYYFPPKIRKTSKSFHLFQTLFA